MASELMEQALRRRAAAGRLEPLQDGTRDPLFDTPRFGPRAGIPPRRRGHCDYGMTEHQLRAYANALAADGWQLWEVTELLGVQPRECTCCARHGAFSDVKGDISDQQLAA